jgi:hypothetical protein
MQRTIAILALLLFTGTSVAQDIPDEARKQLTEALGGPYLVFRDKVQDDLKLSTAQKGTLAEELPNRIHETMAFFQKMEGTEPAEREKALGEYRKKAHETLMIVLKEALSAEQLKRLRQLELQQAGAFALGGEVGKDLKISDDQRKQFMDIVQEMQKKFKPLVKEAQSGGNPGEIRPKLLKIRREHERKIEAILTEEQRVGWKAMLGKPLDLED